MMRAIQCPKCKASLENINSEQTHTMCSFCRATIDLSKPTEDIKISNISNMVLQMGVSTEVHLEKGFIFLEEREWENAEWRFKEAIHAEPKSALAYLGLLLVETKLTKEEELENYNTLLSEKMNYRMAIRFADDALKQRLERYNEAIISKLDEKQAEVDLTVKDLLKVARESEGGASRKQIGLSIIFSIIITDVVSFFIHGELRLINLNLFRSWSNLNGPGWTVVMFFFVYLVLLWALMLLVRKTKK